MSRSLWVAVSATSAFLTVPGAALATDADFQDFFFDVCASPTGALAQRCSETDGGLGNVSGDSESSLNPSQALSSNTAQLTQARTRGKQARERGERLRDGPAGDAAGPGSRMSLLVHARGNSFESERVVDVDAERGLDGDAWGAEVGFDYRIGDGGFVGAIVGFEQSELDFVAENPGTNFTPAASAGDSSDDSVSLTFFGSVNLTDSFFFEGSAGIVSSDLEFRRNSVFQESNRLVPQTNVRTLGETDGDVTWVGVNFGLNKQKNAMTYGPYFGATMSKSSVDGYTETDLGNSGLAMSFDDIDRDSLISHVGFRVSLAKSTQRGVVLPQFRLEYEHESEDPAEVTASYVLDAADQRFGLIGDEPDRDHFETGFGVAWVLPGGWQPFLDLEYLSGNSNLDRYRFAAGFRVEL